MKPFWKHSEEAARRLAARPLLVTLDFDGTLAAIAETPGEAKLTLEFRAALRKLAATPGLHVFILSGRGLRDVMRLVGLNGLYYGGNHGMELKGPSFSWRDPGAARVRSLISGIAAETAVRFPPGTGVIVEDKGVSASIHYRSLRPAYRKGFFTHMKAITTDADRRLRWSRGHKVFELRPARAPHKGDAALLLRRKLRASSTLAVGDDLTDEDMFRALADGVTVRVGRKKGSAAEYYLGRQSQVLELLEFAASYRGGS